MPVTRPAKPVAKQFDLSRKDWKARPAVIIASGPSLTAEDVAIVRASRQADRIRVVSVSNAWKHCADFADAFFAADRRYWKHYIGQMDKAGVPRSRMVTCCNVTAATEKIERVRAANRRGLGTYELTTGGNSGWMGLNLAFLYGARRIYLLGFDMQDSPKGEKHFDGPHPKPLVQAMPFHEWIKRIELALPDLKRHGVEVVNCTRRSALTCFPMSTVEAELAIEKEPA
jgi:hypothetical protein